MSTKLLNSKFNDSEFFDESPILCKLKDSLCEQNSNFFQSSHMNVSTILVDNNELIQLVVSCNGSSTTLDIIIPEIEVIKTSDELILSQEMFPNNIEQSKSKNMSVDDLKSLLFDKPKIVMVDKSTSCHLITAQMSQPNIQSQDVSNEIIVNDPNNCSCDDCPFSKDSVSKLKVIFNESEVSLNDKESVLLIPFSNKLADTNNRNSFLEITSCMPIRGGKLVLHWKVESYKGVLGYRIFVDGYLKSTVHSSRRTCTFISDLDLKRDHIISISIITDPYCPVSQKIADTLEQFYFQSISIDNK